MASRSRRTAGFSLLAALLLLVSAGGFAMTVGCTPLLRQPGSGVLRSETKTSAFREAVQKDRGIPTAAQAGVAPSQ